MPQQNNSPGPRDQGRLADYTSAHGTGLHVAISGDRAVNMVPRGLGANTEILMIPRAGKEFEF